MRQLIRICLGVGKQLAKRLCRKRAIRNQHERQVSDQCNMLKISQRIVADTFVQARIDYHGSKRRQQFLQYICEKSLSGEAATLKERTIAIEVFGRNPKSDLGEDTIVRVGARESARAILRDV